MPPELKAAIHRANWKRALTLYAAAGTMFLLAAVIGPLMVAVGTTPLMTRLVGAFVIGGGLVAIGIPFGIWGAWVHRDSPILEALEKRQPDDIVWLYFIDPPARDRTRTCTVVVGFSDGTTERLATPIDDAELVFRMLQDFAPGATVGWSDDLHERFLSDPAALRAA